MRPPLGAAEVARFRLPRLLLCTALEAMGGDEAGSADEAGPVVGNTPAGTACWRWGATDEGSVWDGAAACAKSCVVLELTREEGPFGVVPASVGDARDAGRAASASPAGVLSAASMRPLRNTRE